MSSQSLNIHSKVKLNNGVEMPIFGLGMYRADPGSDASQAVKYAVKEANYIMIDTAEFYENEADVGKGVAESGKQRDNVFVVSKLFQTKDGREGCKRTFESSLEMMKFDYIDLYLLHAPHGGKVLECYDTLLEYQKNGKLRAVGVSNFGVAHLEALKNSGRPLPTVNQIELHPWCTNEDIVTYCNANNIAVMGYSPLAKANKLSDEFVLEVAKKYNKTPAQVLIRWSLQKGFITIPKSTKPERVVENSNVFDFSLTQEEVEKFDSFGRKEKVVTGWDPTVNPMSEFGPTQ